MDFIVDNYFWFIIGGIVVLMIIIGFIAEKTDFGRKPFREKKVENKESKVTSEQPAEIGVNAEEPVVISEADGSSEIMMEDGLEDIELPENVVEEGNVEVDEQTEEDNQETKIEEPMVDLDIPEIANTDEEVAPETSDIVEEVLTDDSEDDVWKF